MAYARLQAPSNLSLESAGHRAIAEELLRDGNMRRLAGFASGKRTTSFPPRSANAVHSRAGVLLPSGLYAYVRSPADPLRAQPIAQVPFRRRQRVPDRHI